MPIWCCPLYCSSFSPQIINWTVAYFWSSIPIKVVTSFRAASHSQWVFFVSPTLNCTRQPPMMWFWHSSHTAHCAGACSNLLMTTTNFNVNANVVTATAYCYYYNLATAYPSLFTNPLPYWCYCWHRCYATCVYFSTVSANDYSSLSLAKVYVFIHPCCERFVTIAISLSPACACSTMWILVIFIVFRFFGPFVIFRLNGCVASRL